MPPFVFTHMTLKFNLVMYDASYKSIDVQGCRKQYGWYGFGYVTFQASFSKMSVAT